MPEHQQNPEYTQTGYLRIRSVEEAFKMKNYLEENSNKKPMSLTQKIQNTLKFSKKMGVPED